jgi:hypothetical protein
MKSGLCVFNFSNVLDPLYALQGLSHMERSLNSSNILLDSILVHLLLQQQNTSD